MATRQAVGGVFETAQRLVDFLEADGFAVRAAVWALDDEGGGRLYIVPSDTTEGELKQTVRVAYTISKHRDELPDRHDLRYSIVKADDPIIKAVTLAGSRDGHVRGAYSDGIYVDEAYVPRPAA
jgi:hypothetical protein